MQAVSCGLVISVQGLEGLVFRVYGVNQKIVSVSGVLSFLIISMLIGGILPR